MGRWLGRLIRILKSFRYLRRFTASGYWLGMGSAVLATSIFALI